MVKILLSFPQRVKSMKTKNKMSVRLCDVLAIAEHHKLTHAEISEKFNMSIDEVSGMYALFNMGLLPKSNNPILVDINPKEYDFNIAYVKENVGGSRFDSFNGHRNRGRQGTKISDTLAKVGYEPLDAAQLANDNGISVHALRQHRRFDKNTDRGNIIVKIDKETGSLVIYRKQPAEHSHVNK